MEHLVVTPADKPGQPPLLLRVEEAARLLSVGRSKAYELIAAGELESVTIGRSRRVPLDALRAFVARLREEALLS